MNRLRSSLTCLALLTCVLLPACSTLSVSSQGTRLRISVEEPVSALDRESLGAIFLTDRRDGADLRVRILPDARWTLGSEIEDGWFGLELQSGPIRNGALVGFPADLILNAGSMHTEGRIRAELGRTPLTHLQKSVQ